MIYSSLLFIHFLYISVSVYWIRAGKAIGLVSYITLLLHERHSVSNNRKLGSLFINLFGLTSTETSKLCITDPLQAEITGDRPVVSPYKGPVRRKTFLCCDIILAILDNSGTIFSGTIRYKMLLKRKNKTKQNQNEKYTQIYTTY